MSTLSRAASPALDELLGDHFKVLDSGFVRVKDYMGNDATFTEAAKISYNLDPDAPVKQELLIRRLLGDRHTSPFEMCQLRLHVRVPMDCWRQWIRHRTASVNEYSTRYSVAIDDAQRCPPHKWRLQATDNKQGSAGFLLPTTPWPKGYSVARDSLDGRFVVSFGGRELLRVTNHPTPGEWLSIREGICQRLCRETYDERLRFDVAREQARNCLPLATYTEAHWSCDAHNLLHFLALQIINISAAALCGARF